MCSISEYDVTSDMSKITMTMIARSKSMIVQQLRTVIRQRSSGSRSPKKQQASGLQSPYTAAGFWVTIPDQSSVLRGCYPRPGQQASGLLTPSKAAIKGLVATPPGPRHRTAAESGHELLSARAMTRERALQDLSGLSGCHVR